jgi:hypothetical protein
MQIPAGPAGVYRLGELDDYLAFARERFPWSPPLRLELRARVSAKDLPGTWGFGFWNNPFSASLGISGAARRLPVLPNAAWFFFAGEPNYLAFRDTHPSVGFLAGTFSSPLIPSMALAPGALALPLLALPPTARLLRRVARQLIEEDAAAVLVDPAEWHTYRLDWLEHQVRFFVDGDLLLASPVSPRGRLGLVIWLDNQYAAFPPSGQLRYGLSANLAPAWLEIDQLKIN